LKEKYEKIKLLAISIEEDTNKKASINKQNNELKNRIEVIINFKI